MKADSLNWIDSYGKLYVMSLDYSYVTKNKRLLQKNENTASLTIRSVFVWPVTPLMTWVVVIGGRKLPVRLL